MADDIDALYQVPPGEFTSARNALARSKGAAGAEIKALEKPTLPAWAVNQLYWHERATWDALVKAAVAMREAHVKVISGRSADVAAAESAHATTRKAAVKAATRLMEAAGEKATPDTLEAITETLDALPSDAHTPGRLTRPLKPLGFGALMALGIPSGARGPGSKGPGSRVQGPAGSAGPSKKEIAERAAARKAAQKVLRAAEAAEVKAETALSEAKKASVQADREVSRVRDRLVFLEKQRDDAEDAVRKRTRALQEAANLRLQAAQDLERLPD